LGIQHLEFVSPEDKLSQPILDETVIYLELKRTTSVGWFENFHLDHFMCEVLVQR
jgi:hypothetical protein